MKLFDRAVNLVERGGDWAFDKPGRILVLLVLAFIVAAIIDVTYSSVRPCTHSVVAAVPRYCTTYSGEVPITYVCGETYDNVCTSRRWAWEE